MRSRGASRFAWCARLTPPPAKALLAAVVLAWLTATALLAAHRGAARRMQFDGAAPR